MDKYLVVKRGLKQQSMIYHCLLNFFFDRVERREDREGIKIKERNMKRVGSHTVAVCEWYNMSGGIEREYLAYLR